VLRELQRWLADHDVATVRELVGAGHPKAPA